MEKRGFYIGLSMAAAVFVQGCISGKGNAEFDMSSAVLTKLDTAYGYVIPQELKSEKPLVVALINVDFSKTHLLFDFSVGTFEPRKNRGDVYLKVQESGDPLVSLAELREKLEPHVADVPIGIIMMVDGAPLGVGGKSPKPEQNEFFREFAAMMADAGIKYAYIVPEKVTISR